MHPLIHANRPVEHDSLFRVRRRALDKPSAVADALRGNEDALRIQTVEQVVEPGALFANERAGRHLEIVEEQLGGSVIHHRANGPNRQSAAHRLAQVDEQDRQAVGALRHPLDRRRPHDEQQQVGVLRPRDPHLLAANHVRVVRARGGGLQLGRVRAGRRLGHGKGLEAEVAAGDFRQKGTLLRRRTVPQQCAHRVHLSMARRRIAAAAVDLFQNDRCLGHAQAGSAVLFGDQRGEIAGLGQRVDERIRIGALRIEVAPIGIRKGAAQIAHSAPQVLVQFCRRHGMMIDHATWWGRQGPA